MAGGRLRDDRVHVVDDASIALGPGQVDEQRREVHVPW